MDSVSGQEIATRLGEFHEVYRRAFAGAPHFETDADAERFVESLRRHSQREGFRCYVARDAERVVGFGYGYTSRPGQWWHDLIAGSDQGDMGWLDGAFELVTLAVDPSVQGQGIGGRLHDVLLNGLPHHAAALSVRSAEAPALHLYSGRGWKKIIAPFYYPGGNEPFIIMRHDLA